MPTNNPSTITTTPIPQRHRNLYLFQNFLNRFTQPMEFLLELMGQVKLLMGLLQKRVRVATSASMEPMERKLMVLEACCRYC